VIEILVLILLSRKIAGMAEERGLNPILYILALIGCWIVGELMGAFVVALLMILIFHPQEQLGVMCPAFIGAIVGAACGASLVFGIVQLQTPPPARSLFDIERDAMEDLDRPRRKRRRKKVKPVETFDDDEGFEVVEEPPPRPRRRRDVDDDENPVRRSR
jgi:hypothetical protein